MDAAKVELMRALGRLVRGLSALFWGLPLTLLIYAETVRTHWADFLGALGCVPPLAVSQAMAGPSRLRGRCLNPARHRSLATVSGPGTLRFRRSRHKSCLPGHATGGTRSHASRAISGGRATHQRRGNSSA